ncbi:MAG TPA: hypothetical protein VLH77_01025 [Gammaproteobacteria bacterium]|nr:hypothetical protein [Gammaproteobacteria bacterium]
MESLAELLDSIEDDPKFKELERLDRQAPKVLELEKLITRVSNLNGGDEEEFLKEYINHVIENNDIDAALACFRCLARQPFSVNIRK